MAYSFRVYRPSETTEGYDAKQLEEARATIARSKELLKKLAAYDSAVHLAIPTAQTRVRPFRRADAAIVRTQSYDSTLYTPPSNLA